jgi:hypothetical protein
VTNTSELRLRPFTVAIVVSAVAVPAVWATRFLRPPGQRPATGTPSGLFKISRTYSQKQMEVSDVLGQRRDRQCRRRAGQ